MSSSEDELVEHRYMGSPIRLELDEKKIRDPECLFLDLESLYLGSQREYELHFEAKYLLLVEEIFDRMIFKHGIRSVSFCFAVR